MGLTSRIAVFPYSPRASGCRLRAAALPAAAGPSCLSSWARDGRQRLQPRRDARLSQGEEECSDFSPAHRPPPPPTCPPARPQASSSKSAGLLEVVSLLTGLNFNIVEAEICNDSAACVWADPRQAPAAGPSTTAAGGPGGVWKFSVTRKGKKLDNISVRALCALRAATAAESSEQMAFARN